MNHEGTKEGRGDVMVEKLVCLEPLRKDREEVIYVRPSAVDAICDTSGEDWDGVWKWTCCLVMKGAKELRVSGRVEEVAGKLGLKADGE